MKHSLQLIAALGTLALGTAAHAADTIVSYPLSFTPSFVMGSGSLIATVPQFDASLGTLNAIELSVPFAAHANFQAINFGGTPGSISNGTASGTILVTDQDAIGSATLPISVIAPGPYVVNPSFIPVVLASGADVTQTLTTSIPGGSFTPFVGTGTTTYSYGIAAGSMTASSSPDPTVGGGGSSQTSVLSGATVSYSFSAVPEPTTLAMIGLSVLGMLRRPRREAVTA